MEHIETIFIKIASFSNFVNIGSIYAPPSIPFQDFKKDINKLLSLTGSTVIAGDFNAKHHSWNCIKNCRKGNEIASVCSKNSFEIHGPDGMTVFPPRGKPSIVDFVVSKNINGISDVTVIDDLSSDHNPISFEIHSNITIQPRKQILNYKKADWDTFSIKLNTQIAEYNSKNVALNSISSIDTCIENLNLYINTATKKAIPKKQPFSYRHPFSNDIKILTIERNYYRNRYRRSFNEEDKRLHNFLNKLIKQKTTEITSDAWNKKLKKLNAYDYSLYQLTGALKNKRKILPPLMIDSNNLAFSDKDKANTLASAFLKCHNVSINVISPHEVAAENTFNLIQNRSETISPDEVWDEFDIDFIIHKLKIKKAAGYDNISNQILRN